MIYLDNAATSWPKPPQVIQAMTDILKRGCANPGRSAHAMARQTEDAVLNVREAVAKFFNIKDPLRIAFMPNTTYALNAAIYGVITEGSVVATTAMEHNSVLRPLKTLESRGIIGLETVEPDRYGRISVQSIKKVLRKGIDLFCMTVSSNVTGAIMPVTEAGRICRELGITFLVDAAQGAGVIPIDVERMNIDMLAFPGHKGLLGPQGTAGLYVREGIKIKPFIQGGTGSFSDRLFQPEVFPDILESGTLNVPGIVGLGKGISFISETGIEHIRLKKKKLLTMLFEALSKEENITVFSPGPEQNSGIFAFLVHHMDSSEVSYILDRKFGICTRSGFHCAPLAHRALGTSDSGLVRISPGYFNNETEIELTIEAIRSIARRKL
ncbi:cysteine desulfurase CsdB [Thermoclostridium stercorarium subsp. stercorarium DSM 8532]|uniref:cysteine desulfurase n=2 Tax=Thermoclostridium stercorarium TaxID=1510 RepID=L7VM87_THES1|nr:aminotransferase class V-fold PLP-dependent enzyme [Thermoclostridium stercorarium]AGC69330.1 cysteine desulfurase CsdB [Thermoclostridium stercorarium subsp. stercorarium DSM 8532]AGI40295.1 cysteine desulfurase [Thermoclostridium stercorarium subsp. stercorarium DSM 8532]ANX02219.1 cysteine desulfurase [Thermoclostridium stercorarium subsp. leptospartum DSM 9219]